MSKLIEVNQTTVISVKTYDGDTAQFPRARVYNAAGVEQTGAPWNSPIALTHLANGYYQAQVTPNAEGEFSIVTRIFSDAGFTTLNRKYNEIADVVSVRSVDQDLATLLTRITGLIETKAEADARQAILVAEHDATQASLATVDGKVDVIDSNVDAILVDTSTTIPAQISAVDAKIDIIDSNVDAILVDTGTTIPAQIDAQTVTLVAEHDATQAAIAALNNVSAAQVADAVWDELLADHVAAGSMGENQNLIDNINSTVQTNLDATVSSRATQTSVDTIDANVDAILVDTSTTIPAQISAVDAKIDIIDTNVDAIKVITDQITFTSGRVDSVLAATERDDIVDRVWDEPLAGHNTAGTTGLALFNSGAAADPAVIAAAVWDEAINLHTTAGTFGATNQGELTAARAASLDNLDATISSRATQTSVDTIDANVDAILVDTGTDIPSQLTTIEGKVDTVDGKVDLIETKAQADARQVALIAEHDATQATLATIETKAQADSRQAILVAEHDATQAAISNIQNNTTFQGIVPPVLIKDLLAPKTYKLYARLNDTNGNPEDPDSNIMNLRIETTAGGIVVGTVGMTRTGVGQYEYIYTVNPGDLERPLVVFFEYAEGAINFQQVRTTEVAEQESKLDTLLSRLTAGRASNLDYLDAAITSRESEASAAARAATDQAEHDATQAAIATAQSGITGIKAKTDQLNFSGSWVRAQVEVNNDKTGYSLAAGQVASIADAVWDEAQAGHTAAGTFGRYLDAQVSLLETEASALARANTNQAEHDATQATLATVNGNVSAIKTKTDQLTFTGANVNANAQVVSDKTGYALSGAAEDGLVDKVWDEPNAAHLIAGSTGESLNDAGSGASATDIADAVWDEARAGHVAAGSFGESLQGIISTTRANNLDNLDATVSSRATQASVDGIQNTTRFQGIVPSVLVKPASGSKTYKLYARLSDTNGNPEDPDGLAMNFRIEDTAGGIVVGTSAMSRTGVGQYETSYVVNAADAERALVVFFEYAENAINFQQVRVTEVQEFESKLDTLLARLTAPRAANLDNLDVTISSRQSEANALSRFNSLITEHDQTQIDIAAVQVNLGVISGKVDVVDTVVDAIKAKTDLLNFNGPNVLAEAAVVSDKDDYGLSIAAQDALVDKVWDELVAGHAIVGSMGERMSRLDANISSRAAAADLATVAAQVNRLDTDYTTVRAGLIDNLDAAISTRATQASVDALPTVADIADGVLDEPLAGHTTVGTVGEALNNLMVTVDPAAIADAVWDEARVDHVAVGSFGEVLDAAISSRATQASVDAIPTNPLLTNDARLDNLDAPVSSAGGGGGLIVPDLVGSIENEDEITS